MALNIELLAYSVIDGGNAWISRSNSHLQRMSSVRYTIKLFAALWLLKKASAGEPNVLSFINYRGRCAFSILILPHSAGVDVRGKKDGLLYSI